MKMTLLIPTYRRPEDLLRCFHSLAKQTRYADEIIFVVRNTDEETQSMLKSAFKAFHYTQISPTVWGISSELGYLLKVVTVNQPGQVAALNAGLAESTGDIISITDDDAVPHPYWLDRIEAHFLENPNVGGVGGRDWLYFGEELQAGQKETVGRLRWFGSRRGNHHLGYGQVRSVEILKGANMSFRRTAIADLKFDERLRGTGAQVHNDLAFSLAVKKAGWTLIYDPAVSIDHLAAPRFDEDQRHTFNETAFTNAVHNETLAVLEYFSPINQLVFVLWCLLVGNRQAFGLVQLLRFLPSEGQQAVQKWQLSMSGRWQGLQTWAEQYRQPPTPPMRQQQIVSYQ